MASTKTLATLRSMLRELNRQVRAVERAHGHTEQTCAPDMGVDVGMDRMRVDREDDGVGVDAGVKKDEGKETAFVSARNKDHQWQRFVMATYRRHAAEPADSARAAQLRQDAEDYVLLLRSTRRHEELLLYYNPPLSDKEMVEKSARRVGLQLPDVSGIRAAAAADAAAANADAAANGPADPAKS